MGHVAWEDCFTFLNLRNSPHQNFSNLTPRAFDTLPQVVDLLVDAGADVESPTNRSQSDGRACLQEVATHENSEHNLPIMDRLIAAGAIVNRENEHGETALYSACEEV